MLKWSIFNKGLRQGLVGLRIVFLFAMLGTPRVMTADPITATDHEIKAAFIYNFAKFVDWPANRFPDQDSPLIIGVVGKGAVQHALEGVVRDRQLNARKVVVKAIETPEAARNAHLLFISSSEDKRLDTWLPALANTSVLTIGESAAFDRAGGTITFVREGEKLRFEINLDGADKAGIKISAQLQKVARAVRRGP